MKCEWDMPDIICEVTFRRFQSSMLEKQFGTFALTVVFLLCQNFKLAMLTIFPVIPLIIYCSFSSKVIKDHTQQGKINGLVDMILELFPVIQVYGACQTPVAFRRAFLCTAFGIARIWRASMLLSGNSVHLLTDWGKRYVSIHRLLRQYCIFLWESYDHEKSVVQGKTR